VLQQEVDDRLAGDVVGRLQAQLGKLFVRAHQGRWGIGQQVKKAFQIGAGRGLLEIFNDVELDVTVAQDSQRASGLASDGIVVDE
jgi:hypothetical protein